MNRDEALHEELMAALQTYFKANQRWASTGTKRSGIELRHELSNIRRICSEQRIVVRDWMDAYEIVLKTRLEKKRFQDQQGTKGTDDN